ncbi:hypothetical protein [Actinomycetospora atypica]|uniref:Uncharacterized protein n=1 Tax=Actinomycetospora atypica TaxID=1290095 RepID=A0ABV9YVF4_9PSEU
MADEAVLRAALAEGGLPARLALADHLLRDGRAEEADRILADAVTAAADREERVRAVTARVLHQQFHTPEPRDVEPVLAHAEAAAGGPEPALDALRGGALVACANLDEGLALADAVLADADALDPAVAIAVWAVGTARALNGRSERLAELVDRGLAAAARVPELAGLQPQLADLEILDADLRGRPDLLHRRLRWVRDVLPLAEASEWTALFEVRMAVSAGRPRHAIETVGRALATATGRGGNARVALLAAMVARCQGALGDAAAARAALEHAEAHQDPAIGIHDFELDLARAWTAAAEGDLEVAVGHCRDGADRCRTHGLHAAEVLMRQTAVRLGGGDQLARLTELDRMLDTPRAHLAAAHAAAVGSHDGERLLVIADALEEAGMCLEAADAAAQAVVFVRHRHRPTVQAAAEDRARELAATGEGAHTPALLAALGGTDAAATA